MSTTGGVRSLGDLIKRYLRGRLTGREFVRGVDDLVSQDQLYDLPPGLDGDFHQFHVSLGLCVWDDATEAEAPGAYIREPELRDRARAFGQLLKEETGGES